MHQQKVRPVIARYSPFNVPFLDREVRSRLSDQISIICRHKEKKMRQSVLTFSFISLMVDRMNSCQKTTIQSVYKVFYNQVVP